MHIAMVRITVSRIKETKKERGEMRMEREKEKGSTICNTCGEKSDFLYKLNSILDTLRFLKCPTRCLSIHIPEDDPSLSSSIQLLSPSASCVYSLAKILSRFCYRATKITCSPAFIYVSRSAKIIGDNAQISRDSLRRPHIFKKQ